MIHSIMFVCHGNICRSPMAEAVMKNIVREAGEDSSYHIVSRATSREEIGNGIHEDAMRVLDREGIAYGEHVAEQVRKSDYQKYDLFVIMDENNRNNLGRISDEFKYDNDDKVHMLLEYTHENRDVDDPWYTHRFDDAYDDIYRGCKALYAMLKEENKCRE